MTGPATADVELELAPARGYKLGEVNLWIDSFAGFDHQTFVTRVRLIGDGTTLDAEALQSGSLPRRSATVNLPEVESADLATLRGYYRDVTPSWCITPEETVRVVVTDFTANLVLPGVWACNLGLLEVPV
jgi:hypothetical protein